MNKDTILGIVRHILTFGGGFAMERGLMSADDVTATVAAVITLAGVAWSVVEKSRRMKDEG
ncbi:MAG: hypothetical protein HY360_07610 [Verrucomicrobia bacterium]|nr:hypothetical protein [Verrucomicrobiota bacterium]